MRMEFENDEEARKFVEWDAKHIKTCPLYGKDGAIGGRLKFCVTGTSLGNISVIKCACGAKLDLTDYESW